MAISNFIPTIWTETLNRELTNTFIAVNHCCRDYEGEIKGKGSTVKICEVGPVTLKNYTKNSEISAPDTLSDSAITLTIDQSKYFNFQIDDIDKVQCSPKLMEGALQRASEAIANEADRYVLSLTSQADVTLRNDDTSLEPAYETILKARQILYENNVTDGTEVFLEVPPVVASQILREKILVPTNENSFETGYLGSVFGCKIYVTNNLPKSNITGESAMLYSCLLRTRRAISFVDQISEIEAYRPEKHFADAVKGLHLYGAKVMYPKEMVKLLFKFPTAA